MQSLPITKDQFKEGIVLATVLILLGAVYPLLDDGLRSALGSKYFEIRPLITIAFWAFGIFATVSFIIDLNLIKFKKDNDLEFTPRELEKIKTKLEI